MQLQLKETTELVKSSEREHWIDDPYVSSYVTFREKNELSNDSEYLTYFKKYYEIYESQNHVGDIKIFYETEEDIMKKRAQILMVIGERNKGIGTNALSILLEKIKDNYVSVYCNILRSNIASLKILKRNGFIIEKIEGENLQLSRQLF